MLPVSYTKLWTIRGQGHSYLLFYPQYLTFAKLTEFTVNTKQTIKKIQCNTVKSESILGTSPFRYYVVIFIPCAFISKSISIHENNWSSRGTGKKLL